MSGIEETRLVLEHSGESQAADCWRFQGFRRFVLVDLKSDAGLWRNWQTHQI